MDRTDAWASDAQYTVSHGNYPEPRDPNGRGWKTLLAMIVALARFPLFFIFLFWLVAGAPLP
jgi:hypothetical protein